MVCKSITPANFVDVKHRIDEPEVQRVLSLSMFQPSPESIARVIHRCRSNDNRKLWGIVDSETVIGVVEFYVRDDDTVYIANLAVLDEYRGKGIGRLIIKTLQENHKLPLELETDDDAIDFYRKCGFEASPFEKHNVRRWKCVLPV